MPTATASPSVAAHLPWWALAVLVVVGAVLGQLTARELATGGYRIEDDEADGPAGRMWWPAATLAVLWLVVGWFVGDVAHWAAAPAYLLFGWMAVALTWIDLDVHRLPVGIVWPGAAGVVVLLAIATLSDGGGRWLGALIGMALMWVIFFVLALLPGGMGWGDVRLAPVVGLLLGWLGWRYLQSGLIAVVAIGGLGALALMLRGRGRKADYAYGPAICAGVFVGIVWASQIMASTTGG